MAPRFMWLMERHMSPNQALPLETVHREDLLAIVKQRLPKNVGFVPDDCTPILERLQRTPECPSIKPADA